MRLPTFVFLIWSRVSIWTHSGPWFSSSTLSHPYLGEKKRKGKEKKGKERKGKGDNNHLALRLTVQVSQLRLGLLRLLCGLEEESELVLGLAAGVWLGCLT